MVVTANLLRSVSNAISFDEVEESAKSSSNSASHLENILAQCCAYGYLISNAHGV